MAQVGTALSPCPRAESSQQVAGAAIIFQSVVQPSLRFLRWEYAPWFPSGGNFHQSFQ